MQFDIIDLVHRVLFIVKMSCKFCTTVLQRVLVHFAESFADWLCWGCFLLKAFTAGSTMLIISSLVIIIFKYSPWEFPLLATIFTSLFWRKQYKAKFTLNYYMDSEPYLSLYYSYIALGLFLHNIHRKQMSDRLLVVFFDWVLNSHQNSAELDSVGSYCRSDQSHILTFHFS